MTKRSTFSNEVINIIKSIPKGKVATYGQIAALAGNPRGARQVTWLLHSATEKENLPWHRVVNSQRRISLPKEGGYEEQKMLLISEGVVFDSLDRIDFHQFLWNPLTDKIGEIDKNGI
ncbi:MGMT family protein [Candidatus Hodarchaeum mangrovi]